MPLRVQCYGGGTNSAGLAVGCYEKEIPINVRLFSHVGSDEQKNEWPETYIHMEIMDKWFVSHGLPTIEWCREDRFTLEQQCLDNHTMPSIVLGMRSCSDKFKIRPQNRWLRKYQPAMDVWAAGERVVKLVGFDVGEAHRIKDYDNTMYIVKYPLVEWGWDRSDCDAALRRHGLPPAPKSSCFFCPEMQWHEIKKLRDVHPDLMDRALYMEATNTSMHEPKGLARSISWKDALVMIDTGRVDELPKRMRRMPCVCAT